MTKRTGCAGRMGSAGIMIAALAMPGCINTEFGCKGYPEGAQCQAVSQVAALDPTETGGYLSEGRPRRSRSEMTAEAAAGDRGRTEGERRAGDAAVVGQPAMQLGKPIVRPPEVVRAWLAPWRDEQDRLHEASYVYIMVTPAEWAYTGPALGKPRKERVTTIVPKAPVDRPAERSNGASAAAAPVGRPTPQAAGVAHASSGKASSGATPSAVSSPASSVSGGVLMVPGAQGMRPVPLPQVPHGDPGFE